MSRCARSAAGSVITKDCCNTLSVHWLAWSWARCTGWSTRRCGIDAPIGRARSSPAVPGPARGRRRGPVPACGAGSTGSTCGSPGRWSRSMPGPSRPWPTPAARRPATSAGSWNGSTPPTRSRRWAPPSHAGDGVSRSRRCRHARCCARSNPTCAPRWSTTVTWLARRATVLSPAELRRELTAEVRALEADGGRARLERQRRAARLRTWVDPDGMWRFDGRFDPETGLRLHTRLLATTAAALRRTGPPEARPTTPIERQAFLRARAWVALLDRTTTAQTGTDVPARHRHHRNRHRHRDRSPPATGPPPAPRPHRHRDLYSTSTGAGARTELASRPGSGHPADRRPRRHRPRPHGLPSIDWGLPVELPLDLRRRCFDEGHVSCVIVRNGVIIHAPGTLNLGRTTRLANRAQRRALRALYPACAIPGCEHPLRALQAPPRHPGGNTGGRTDLDNLLPALRPPPPRRPRHRPAPQAHPRPPQLTITYPDTTHPHHRTTPTRRAPPPPTHRTRPSDRVSAARHCSSRHPTEPHAIPHTERAAPSPRCRTPSARKPARLATRNAQHAARHPPDPRALRVDAQRLSTVQALMPGAPYTWVNAVCGSFGTWRSPASPRSCRTHS